MGKRKKHLDLQVPEPEEVIQEKKKKKKKRKKQPEQDEEQEVVQEIPRKKKKEKTKEPVEEIPSISEEISPIPEENITENSKKKKKKKHKGLENDNVEPVPETSVTCDELPRERNGGITDPNFISDELLHTLIPKLMPLNEDDQQLIKKQNLMIQSGRFNKIENAILKRNWQRYLEDYHIPNPTLLFGHFQYEKQDKMDKQVKKEYQEFAKRTNLWLRLAKDLPNRTLYQIYCRARFFLSDLKCSKDLSPEDRQMILDLYRKHGDRYTSFCGEYGFNPKTAREIVRHSIKADGTQLKRGEWTEKENRKLRKVVQKLVNELKLDSYDGIPWSRVSKKLKRSDIQCRQRFFSKAIFSMVSATNPELGSNWDDKLDMAKFIALLKNLNYSDQQLIDWDFIKEKFSSAYFNLLLRRWRELKVRVPDHEQKSLPEIVDYLYEKRVVKIFDGDPEKMEEIQNFASS